MIDFGNIIDDGNNIKELQIEKYPMAESPNLFEYFLIMGYEESYKDKSPILRVSVKKGEELWVLIGNVS